MRRLSLTRGNLRFSRLLGGISTLLLLSVFLNPFSLDIPLVSANYIPAPTNLRFDHNAENTITMKWDYQAELPDGFALYRSPEGGNNWNFVRSFDSDRGTITQTDVYGLSCGTTYWYEVAAFKGSDGSYASNVLQASTANCPDNGGGNNGDGNNGGGNNGDGNNGGGNNGDGNNGSSTLQILNLQHYISQYQHNGSSYCDCGPTTVAMALYYYGIRTELSDNALIADVRGAIVRNFYGEPRLTYGCSNTHYLHLETALNYYNQYYDSRLSYSEIDYNLSQDDVIQAVKDANRAGKLSIFPIDEGAFGRYNDKLHWVLVTGFSSDGNTVYLSDPDNQSPVHKGWIKGGQISVPTETLKRSFRSDYRNKVIIVSH